MNDTVTKFDWRKWVFPKREGLGDDLTTIDWLKTLAVITMIIDHVGFYLFPEVEWFRVIGRMSAPIWFFLVGYARRQDIDMRWLAAALILFVADMLVMRSPVPLNVLFTLLLCRFAVPYLWQFLLAKPVYFWWTVMLLLFAGPVTNTLILEYGTFGLLFAAVGYAMRRREEISPQFTYDPVPGMFIAIMLVYTIYEIIYFGFSTLASLVTIAEMLGIYFVLTEFQSRTLPDTAGQAHAPLIRFMGRYTLEIYVIHLLILKFIFGLSLAADWVVG